MQRALGIGVPSHYNSIPGMGGFMTRTSVSSLPVRRRAITITLAIVTAVLALAGSADAGPRRARLSRDLSERIAQADASVTSVIVEGDSNKIQTLARRYGAKVLKTLGLSLIHI